MATNFSCPSCGAQYDTTQVSPGTTFECGACGSEVSAPARVPAAPAARAASSGAARNAPRSAARRPAARSSAAPRGASKGPSKGVVIGLVAGLVVVVGVVLAVALGGDDESGGGAGTPAPPPRDVAKEIIEEVRAAHTMETANGAWEASQSIAAKLESEGALTTTGRRILEKEAAKLRKKVLSLDPDYAAAREALGHRRYQGELEEFASADWLDDVDQSRARDLHKRLETLAAKDAGWVPAGRLAAADTLLTDLAQKKKAHEELTSSPWYRKASALEAETLPDLDQRFNGSDDEKAKAWRGGVMACEPPFVIFFQKDPSWDPEVEKKRVAANLCSVHETIMAEFGEDLNLKEFEGPIPVIYFRNRDLYRLYKGEKEITSEAHFEPWSGRLVVHDSCDHETLRHETTHQSMWGWTEPKYATPLRSYWFQEGIAEWYGTSRRTWDEKAEKWAYVVGKVHADHVKRLLDLKANKFKQEKVFSLKQLLRTRYADKPRIKANGQEGLIYSEGWFLIFFMNYFNVDAEGYVHPDRPGQYREGWKRYVAAELRGKTGLEAFKEAMSFSDEDLVRIEDEMWKFAKYVRYKQYAMKQVNTEGQLIPWSEYVNKRGLKTGEKEDDLLVRP